VADPIEDEVIARQAVVTQAAFAGTLERTEGRLVDELVNMFRIKDLHNERAWALIGTISTLRAIATDARTDANAAAGFVRIKRAPDGADPSY